MRWLSRFTVHHAEPRRIHHRPFRHARDAKAIVVEEIARTAHFAMCRRKLVLLPEKAIAYTGILYENLRGQR
jgi:hypothetical protein